MKSGNVYDHSELGTYEMLHLLKNIFKVSLSLRKSVSAYRFILVFQTVKFSA